jgi:hypothetical protein
MKNTLLIVSLIICLFSSVGMTYQPLRWFEYKFESAPSEKKTNELASQGWELVAVESAGAGRVAPTYIFKRAK